MAMGNKYRELSNKLGVAAALFVPKPSGLGTSLNASRSQLLELLANASQLHGGDRAPSTIHGGGCEPAHQAHNIVGLGNESNLNYTANLLLEIGQAVPADANFGDDFRQF